MRSSMYISSLIYENEANMLSDPLILHKLAPPPTHGHTTLLLARLDSTKVPSLRYQFSDRATGCLCRKASTADRTALIGDQAIVDTMKSTS